MVNCIIIESILKLIFKVVIFPGLFFTLIIGLLLSWLERKVTARLQWRKGPPLFQPIYDIVKLWGKETILPANGSQIIFLIAPILGLIGITIVSLILWVTNLYGNSFVGDVIVVVYLLTLPSLSVILAGASSGNPLASIGTSREIKLVLAYELPFLISLATVIVKASGSININEISKIPMYSSISGIFAMIVAVFCIQAKLGFTPFDIAEAETEIIAGPLIEYTGTPLSLFKIMQSMMLFTLPVFISTIFLAGLKFNKNEIIWSVVKILSVVVIMIIIKNTNPRIRIDHAVKFFWGFCSIIAIIALILAVFGNLYNITWL